MFSRKQLKRRRRKTSALAVSFLTSQSSELFSDSDDFDDVSSYCSSFTGSSIFQSEDGSDIFPSTSSSVGSGGTKAALFAVNSTDMLRAHEITHQPRNPLGSIGIYDSLLSRDDATSIASTNELDSSLDISIISSKQIHDDISKMAKWTCDFCREASFETEHEAMVHELSCLCNAGGPLVEDDNYSKNKSKSSLSNEERGRRYARKLLGNLSQQKTNRRKWKDSIMSSSTQRRDRDTFDIHRKSGSKFHRRVKSLLLKKRSHKKAKDKVSNEMDTVIQSLDTASITLEDDSTTATFENDIELEHNSLATTSEIENNHLLIKSNVNEVIPKDSSTPVALQRRVPSEHVLKKLGLGDKAKMALAELRREDSFSSDDSSSSSLSSPSWEQGKIHGISLPRYQDYVHMAVTTFRRNILGINDQLYETMKKVDDYRPT